MDRARAEAVIAKGLEWQRPERGPLFGKHRRHLALGRAVDPRVGPAILPAIQIGLRGLQRLEAQALERRLLRVAAPRLAFPYPLGIAHESRQLGPAIVFDDVVDYSVTCQVICGW